MTLENPKSGKIEKDKSREEVCIQDACIHILNGPTLESKLTPLENVLWAWKENVVQKDYFKEPGRPSNLKFSLEKMKFPKDHELKKDHARAKALHFFANHELLAVEVMAKMILVLPNTQESLFYKKEIWKTLQDEQRHLALYRQRLNQLGFDLGDFPVNDYFWKTFKDVDSLKSYFALMALTFETANLDFAAFYEKLFVEVGDFSSSEVMKTIFQDEIFHVKLGLKFFNTLGASKTLWKNYVDSLPWPMTPARSKGIKYQLEHRELAGYPKEFTVALDQFTDGFAVTDRRR
jgi:uncharacterized ferritin-like protein (DUF455 family)